MRRKRCPECNQLGCGPVCYAVQCAAERVVPGENAMFALLRCYEFDGHAGLHYDCTMGIRWKVTRFDGTGDFIRRAHERGDVRLELHRRPRGE